jgi:transposase-like protein
MAVDINGELHPLRITATNSGPADVQRWTCERCGYQPPEEDDLTQHLTEMEAEAHR